MTTLQESMADVMNAGAISTLNDDYTFYRYPSGGARPMPGRFFALPTYDEPQLLTDGTYQFVAVVPILNQPNSPVHRSTMTNVEIDLASVVKGESPAEIVAKSHPQLIRHLLA